jgi:predicted enzyme related to lactoylglutathione lyase|tara:strand:- start:833 stop:1342 length:510 start_codon:yes stop_codon:yes gene_type:complete
MSFPRMHVSLYVKDINNTVKFYESFFNKKADKIKDDYAKFIVESPSLIISFVENKEKVNPNFGHLGIQIDSESELLERLAKSTSVGLPILEEMGTNCCYASQDKFWVTDPDGYHWEVYFFHKDVEFNDPRYSKNESEQCCMPVKKKKKVVLNDLSTSSGEVCEPGSGCC